MMLDSVLDAARLARLRRRLAALLASAPAHGLISITLNLGRGDAQWLETDFGRTHTTYRAQPSGGDYRLALGCAMIFSSVGAARFSALQAAFSGLAPSWQHDDGEHTGAVAAAHIGFAFDEGSQADLPNACLVVPAILLQNRGGRLSATFSCAACDGAAAIEQWRAELRAAGPRRPAAHAPPALSRKAAPLNDGAFMARARAALADIALGKLEKVVLTRSVRLDAGQPIDVAQLLATLAARHPECTVFSSGQHGRCFAGASPESLVSLRRGTVHADALAGTAWLCAPSDAAQPGSLTLQGDKNSREQQLVVDAVRAALAPLCTGLDSPQVAQVMQLRELQHLRTRVSGRVRQGVQLFDLIAQLHPTPAVGGAPNAAARQWLQAHSERRAAWYTGGVGWIERDGDGAIAVALRCALIAGAQAEIFAGAGIVAGSDPAQELAETEVKLATIIDALQQAAPRRADAARKTGTQ